MSLVSQSKGYGYKMPLTRLSTVGGIKVFIRLLGMIQKAEK